MNALKAFQTSVAAAALALSPLAAFAEDTSADQTKVVDTVRSLFVAMAHDNTDQIRQLTCPGFYIFDNGKQLSSDELVSTMKKLHAAGNVYVWQVTEPSVHVEGNVAWITYVNQGSITNPQGKKMDMNWLESGVLNRTGNGWCLRFEHSTRAPVKGSS